MQHESWVGGSRVQQFTRPTTASVGSQEQAKAHTGGSTVVIIIIHIFLAGIQVLQGWITDLFPTWKSP